MRVSSPVPGTVVRGPFARLIPRLRRHASAGARCTGRSDVHEGAVRVLMDLTDHHPALHWPGTLPMVAWSSRRISCSGPVGISAVRRTVQIGTTPNSSAAVDVGDQHRRGHFRLRLSSAAAKAQTPASRSPSLDAVRSRRSSRYLFGAASTLSSFREMKGFHQTRHATRPNSKDPRSDLFATPDNCPPYRRGGSQRPSQRVLFARRPCCQRVVFGRGRVGGRSRRLGAGSWS